MVDTQTDSLLKEAKGRELWAKVDFPTLTPPPPPAPPLGLRPFTKHRLAVKVSIGWRERNRDKEVEAWSRSLLKETSASPLGLSSGNCDQEKLEALIGKGLQQVE